MLENNQFDLHEIVDSELKDVVFTYDLKEKILSACLDGEETALAAARRKRQKRTVRLAAGMGLAAALLLAVTFGTRWILGSGGTGAPQNMEASADRAPAEGESAAPQDEPEPAPMDMEPAVTTQEEPEDEPLAGSGIDNALDEALPQSPNPVQDGSFDLPADSSPDTTSGKTDDAGNNEEPQLPLLTNPVSGDASPEETPAEEEAPPTDVVVEEFEEVEDDAADLDESIVPDNDPEVEEEVEEEIEAADDAEAVDVYSPSFRYGPSAVYAGTVSVLQGTVVEYQTVELSLNLQSIPAAASSMEEPAEDAMEKQYDLMPAAGRVNLPYGVESGNTLILRVCVIQVDKSYYGPLSSGSTVSILMSGSGGGLTLGAPYAMALRTPLAGSYHGKTVDYSSVSPYALTTAIRIQDGLLSSGYLSDDFYHYVTDCISG